MDRELCLRRLFLPVTDPDGATTIATADLSAENLSWLRCAFPAAEINEIPKSQLHLEFERRFSAAIVDDAVHGLARATPSLSAQTVLTRAQTLVFGSLAIIFIGMSVSWPHAACGVLAALTSLGFVSGVLFRALLAWIGGGQRPGDEIAASRDSTLPVYSILVPLYREAAVLPRLVRALLLLDYPGMLASDHSG